MTTQKQLSNYRKFLLNRLTVSSQFTDYIEKCIFNEDEAIAHSFHKIMVHSWQENKEALFTILSEYYSVLFTPVNYGTSQALCSFYVNNLNVILKIAKYEFIFPHRRNMYSIDILFNDKTSEDLFGPSGSLDDVVSGIVWRRFNEKFELDLSNFCNEEEFDKYKITFFKINILSTFKTLMTRIGQDTKILNLENNKLSEIPIDVLSFFKGDLIGINLSNNNIPSVAELLRTISRIEKLWLEGNPLCENEDPLLYVKIVTIKFPRLKELDGIPINQHGIIFPFWRNYLVNTDRTTRMLTEKFLTLYFSHYDSSRAELSNFYHENATLTISTGFTEMESQLAPHYGGYSRNICNPNTKQFVAIGQRAYKTRCSIVGVLSSFPITIHDPRTFNVDVIYFDKRRAIIIVDGIYKEMRYEMNKVFERYFQFRRTFIFQAFPLEMSIVYLIKNEMFSITFASKEMVDNSFKYPIRNLNSLCLINPNNDECDAVTEAIQNVTRLNSEEVQTRLLVHGWDVKATLEGFIDDLQRNNIAPNKFINPDDISDLSTDDDID